MTALLRILALWRHQTVWLLCGAGLTVLSVLALAALALAAGATPLAPAVATATITVTSAVILLRVLGASRVGLRYAERLATHAATFRALAALRVRLFRALATRSAGGLGFQSRGDVLSRLVSDVDALDGLYLRILIPLLAALVLLPILAVTLAARSPMLALAVCLLFATATLVIPGLAARATLAQATRLTTAAAALRTAALDAFTGLKEVRAFGNEGHVLARIQSSEAALFDAQRTVSRNASLAQAAATLTAQAALLLILLTPGSGPAVLPALLLTLAAFEAAAPLPRAGTLAGQSAAAAARILETTTVPPHATPHPTTPLPASTALRLEAVRYAWPGRPLLFDGLTLDIPAGSRVAILGPSGAGKSTIAALLLKIVIPTSGQILLGNTDIETLDTPALRTRFAWLSQETHVFADTIRNNLLLARPAADDAALWQALHQAGLAETVQGLPNRLDTWIGATAKNEGGTGLSGGQERRIALARALLSPAPILILDEPATGLDDAAERAFLTTLNDAAPGRTVILIVHRLLGVERIDRIFRLSAGHAVAAAG